MTRFVEGRREHVSSIGTRMRNASQDDRLARIIVDETDGNQAGLRVLAQLANDHRPGFARADDQDSAAIDNRHGIYYDTKTGTLAAVNYYKERTKVIIVDGRAGVKEVSEDLMKKLG